MGECMLTMARMPELNEILSGPEVELGLMVYTCYTRI